MTFGDDITVEMRLAAIEEKLDRLLAHLGLDGDLNGLGAPVTAVDRVGQAGQAGPVSNWQAQYPLAAYEPQLTALIQAGKKIQAIKVYREATGAGLKAAKEAVDAYERNLRANGGWR